MCKSAAFLLSGCVLLLLAGCPKTPQQPQDAVCGGFPGTACPADQYCSYEPDARCGTADATGICKPRPTICTADYRPVCGCDGQTYSNACVAERSGFSVAHDGPCEKQMCGGIANIQCPSGMRCIDDPNDSCDPHHGGADCSGICVP